MAAYPRGWLPHLKPFSLMVVPWYKPKFIAGAVGNGTVGEVTYH